jgi:hypothetical protein
MAGMTSPFADNVIQRIHDADPKTEMRQKRFTLATVYEYAGGIVKCDTGVTLPGGNKVYLEVPCASGFTPAVGQTVAILYSTDSPHSGYAVAAGASASVNT